MPAGIPGMSIFMVISHSPSLMSGAAAYTLAESRTIASNDDMAVKRIVVSGQLMDLGNESCVNF
jgi:hypothetical protein